MKFLIIGGGIGGLTAALALNRIGIDVEIFEQTPELRELGVGINLLPHAVKELASLGLLPALDEAGIRTKTLIYLNRFGQEVWRELRGLDAGYEVPQFSIHRGKLHGVLLRAVLERVEHTHIHTGHRLVDLDERDDRVVATFESRSSGERSVHTGEGLIGADGIHSRVRGQFYPKEGPARWSGILLWRGAAPWPVYEDGRTMVIAGGSAAKFVFYPIHSDPTLPQQRLTNWAIMARIAEDEAPLSHRDDWNAVGQLEEACAFVRDTFRLGFVEPTKIIEASGTFYEYPNCDRDPVARWSFGRVTLLGDAAHPMYPVGSNGASQAILDAAALARHLQANADVAQALTAYDGERRPMTAEIVHNNRRGGPEGVIELVEARAPEGFDDIEAVATYAEREAIVRGYASLAGFSREQVNRGKR